MLGKTVTINMYAMSNIYNIYIYIYMLQQISGWFYAEKAQTINSMVVQFN